MNYVFNEYGIQQMKAIGEALAPLGVDVPAPEDQIVVVLGEGPLDEEDRAEFERALVEGSEEQRVALALQTDVYRAEGEIFVHGAITSRERAEGKTSEELEQALTLHAMMGTVTLQAIPKRYLTPVAGTAEAEA